MLECPDCESNEVEYAGYEVLQEQNGDIVDVIDLVICKRCKVTFPSYNLREN
ncbi:hypothetical protein SAMN05428961_11082 [Paenibacillus sp. OK060]|nr:hypothetical protein SAMN05428961_11082 [Paenibacillus sp. OK060]